MRTNPNAYKVFAITPGVALPRPASGGLWVVATGNITMKVGGVSVTLASVPANVHLPFVAETVDAATATVLGLY